MNIKNIEYRYIGIITDISDSIVTVAGLSKAFCGELVRFHGLHGNIAGFV